MLSVHTFWNSKIEYLPFLGYSFSKYASIFAFFIFARINDFYDYLLSSNRMKYISLVQSLYILSPASKLLDLSLICHLIKLVLPLQVSSCAFLASSQDLLITCGNTRTFRIFWKPMSVGIPNLNVMSEGSPIKTLPNQHLKIEKIVDTEEIVDFLMWT